MISFSRGMTRTRTNSRVTRRISAKSSAETWEAAGAVEVTAAFLSGYDRPAGAARPGSRRWPPPLGRWTPFLVLPFPGASLMTDWSEDSTASSLTRLLLAGKDARKEPGRPDRSLRLYLRAAAYHGP